MSAITIFVAVALFLPTLLAENAPILPLYAQTQGSAMYFFPNLRGTTAFCSISYDLEVGMEYASVQMTDADIFVEFYAMFNDGVAYLVTSKDGNALSCQALDIRQQPIPSPNFMDSHGQYAGNALVGQSPTAHWQMDVDGDEQESSLSMKSDLYFLTATLDVPSLPIRQVTQYFVEEDYLGMLIMDFTATSITKPPSEVFQPPEICFTRALLNSTADRSAFETNMIARSVLLPGFH